MVKTFIEHKNIGYFLQTAAFLLNLTVILTIIILTETARVILIFGSVLLILLAFVYFNMKIVSFLMYVSARNIFRIYSEYKVFYRIILICNVIYALGILLDKLLVSQMKGGIWLFLINPLIILAAAVLYYFCRRIFQASQIRSLLFSASFYLIFLLLGYRWHGYKEQQLPILRKEPLLYVAAFILAGHMQSSRKG